MNTYNNYQEAMDSRICWYIGCKCKGKKPPVGNKRQNGKDGKKDSNSRRFHTTCSHKFNDAYSHRREHNSETCKGMKKVSEIENAFLIKPEFQEFNTEYWRRKVWAMKNSKK